MLFEFAFMPVCQHSGVWINRHQQRRKPSAALRRRDQTAKPDAANWNKLVVMFSAKNLAFKLNEKALSCR